MTYTVSSGTLNSSIPYHTIMHIYNYAKFHHDPSRDVSSPYTSVCAVSALFFIFLCVFLQHSSQPRPPTDSYATRHTTRSNRSPKQPI